MNIQLLSGPVIGALIGYCTNYIAVKMLFRPLKPIMIGKYQLPFTPGIIPKGKNRLAKAIGEAVGGTLLSEEVMAKTLLSHDIKNKIQEEINHFLIQDTNDQKTIGQIVSVYLGKDRYEEQLNKLEETITGKILERAARMELGDKIAREAAKAVKEKVQGGFLALMLNDSLLESFIAPIGEGIDNYIEENGREMLLPVVKNELQQITEKNTQDMKGAIAASNIDIGEIAVKIYENLINDKLASIMKVIDVKEIVENKIVEMDVLEVENLTLSVMKKELNAIVNLGAVIGLLIGILNIFI